MGRKHNGNCSHSDAKLIFETPIPVYQGAGLSKTPVPQDAVILDLAGEYTPVFSAQGFSIPGLTDRNPYLRIDWKDGGTPKITADEWATLAAALINAGRPVFVACMGGHGRTGTAIAVLGHFLGAYPDAATDPIAYVRERGCAMMVEWANQKAYVKAMTGRASAAEPSMALQEDEAPAGRAKGGALYGGAARWYATHGNSAWCPKHSRCLSKPGHAGPCIGAAGKPLTPEGKVGEKQASLPITTAADDYEPAGGDDDADNDLTRDIPDQCPRQPAGTAARCVLFKGHTGMCRVETGR